MPASSGKKRWEVGAGSSTGSGESPNLTHRARRPKTTRAIMSFRSCIDGLFGRLRLPSRGDKKGRGAGVEVQLNRTDGLTLAKGWLSPVHSNTDA